MERFSQGQHKKHIQHHLRRHDEIMKFVEEAIDDVSKGRVNDEILSAIGFGLDDMSHNMKDDDFELYHIMFKEKYSIKSS